MEQMKKSPDSAHAENLPPTRKSDRLTATGIVGDILFSFNDLNCIRIDSACVQSSRYKRYKPRPHVRNHVLLSIYIREFLGTGPVASVSIHNPTFPLKHFTLWKDPRPLR